MRPFMLFMLIAFIFTFPSTAQDNKDLNSAREEVLDIERQWAEALSTENFDKILTFYAPDVVILMNGLPPLKGVSAAEKYIDAAFKDPSIKWDTYTYDIGSVEVSSSGDMAVFWATDKFIRGDAPVGGKYIDVFKKIDGEWKCILSMTNDLNNEKVQPPPPPKKIN